MKSTKQSAIAHLRLHWMVVLRANGSSIATDTNPSMDRFGYDRYAIEMEPTGFRITRRADGASACVPHAAAAFWHWSGTEEGNV